MRTKLRSKATLLFIVCAALLSVAGTAMAITADPSGSTSPAPTIQSDKADYAPGELVTLTGGNWKPGESVHINVNDTYGASWSRNVDVPADASGNITDSFNLPDWFVSDYDVTATGAESGTATTTFTDSVQDVTITSPTSASPTTLTSLPGTVTVNFNYATSATGTTTATATLFDASTTVDSVTKNITAGGTPSGPKSDSISLSVAAGTANGNYNVRVRVENSTGGWANQATDNESNAVVINAPTTRTLSVSKTGAGTGTVTSNPPGINCGSTCSASFNNGQSVTLTATPGANSTFNGWSGDCTGTTCTVTMDANKSVSALFKANQTITFAQPTSPQTFGATFNVNPTASSGLAVTVQASGGCSIQAVQTGGYDVTMTSGTNNCVLTASQAGNGDYNAATDVTRTVVAQKANQAALTVEDPDEGTFGQHLPITTSGGTTNGALSFDTGTSSACQIDNDNKLEITSGTGS
jgi:hypothetical protein